MNRYLIKNEKGLFGNLQGTPILTQVAFDHIQQWITDPSCELYRIFPLNNHDKTELKSFLDMVQSFKKDTVWMDHIQKNDIQSNLPLPSHLFGFENAYFYYRFNGFYTSRVEHENEETIEDIKKTLEVLLKWKVSSRIKDLLEIAEISFKMPTKSNILKQLEQLNHCVVENIVPALDLGTGHSFVLYLGEGGYLTYNGTSSPSLASARQFESVEAILRTAKAQKILDGVIVQTQIQIQSTVESDKLKLANTDRHELNQALALAEQQKLRSFLSNEDINHKLELLEKVQQEHPEWFEETQLKSSQTKNKKIRL